MKQRSTIFLLVFVVFVLAGCHRLYDLLDEVKPIEPTVREYATGFNTPLGLELDSRNRIWVTEAGTGNNDGRVSLIMPNGRVYPVIEGFVSVVDPEGNPSGLNHLILKNGMLWILHGAEGRLYMADVTDFKAGDMPLQASELTYEEVGAFVMEQDFHESNLYNLSFGPDGDLFMVDAGANAIIRRDAETAELSVFATFPDFENPTQIGPPMVNAVPTGIVYDGNRFLVSTLTGFPFLEGEAKIYAVDRNGNVSVYQDGFTTLVDIDLGLDKQPVVLQFAEFGPTGFIPETGRIIRAAHDRRSTLTEGLSFPTDIELAGIRTAYVTNMAEGKVLKVKY